MRLKRQASIIYIVAKSPRMTPAYDISGLAASLSSPEVRTTIETLWKINDMRAELRVREQQLDADLEGMGFPMLSKGENLR